MYKNYSKYKKYLAYRVCSTSQFDSSVAHSPLPLRPHRQHLGAPPSSPARIPLLIRGRDAFLYIHLYSNSNLRSSMCVFNISIVYKY